MNISNITHYKPKEFAELLHVSVKTRQRWDREKMILVSHKDRFVRFEFDWFEKFCNKFNVEIVVVKNEKLSPHDTETLSAYGSYPRGL